MMKKIFKIILLLIILLIVLITILIINKKKYIFDKIYNSVVYVKGEDENSSKEGCGFVYKILDNKAYILTNYHVIEGYYLISVKNINNDEASGKVVYYDDRNDIALIEINNILNLQSISIGNSSNMNMGYKLSTLVIDQNGKYNHNYNGQILDYVDMHSFDMDFSAIKTNIKINYGNSGGAIFNNKGEVVGMIFLKDNNTDEALVIPIDFIVKSINEHSDSKSIALGGSFVSASDKEILNDYEISCDLLEGVVIINVDTNGLIYKNNLKIGDIIVEINDKKIKNVQDLREGLKSLLDYDSIKIKYYRGGIYNQIIIEF